MVTLFLKLHRTQGESLGAQLKRVDWLGTFIFISATTSFLVPLTRASELSPQIIDKLILFARAVSCTLGVIGELSFPWSLDPLDSLPLLLMKYMSPQNPWSDSAYSATGQPVSYTSKPSSTASFYGASFTTAHSISKPSKISLHSNRYCNVPRNSHCGARFCHCWYLDKPLVSIDGHCRVVGYLPRLAWDSCIAKMCTSQ